MKYRIVISDDAQEWFASKETTDLDEKELDAFLKLAMHRSIMCNAEHMGHPVLVSRIDKETKIFFSYEEV